VFIGIGSPWNGRPSRVAHGMPTFGRATTFVDESTASKDRL